MPAGKTYEPIETATISSVTNTVTFSSIPASYTDLVLVISSKFSNYPTAGENIWIRLNNDSGSNYSSNYFANGPAGGTIPNQTQLVASMPGNTGSAFSINIWNFFNYSNTNTFKSILWNLTSDTAFVQQWTGLWRNTGAINTINIKGGTSGTFDIGSTFTLYGIAAA